MLPLSMDLGMPIPASRQSFLSASYSSLPPLSAFTGLSRNNSSEMLATIDSSAAMRFSTPQPPPAHPPQTPQPQTAFIPALPALSNPRASMSMSALLQPSDRARDWLKSLTDTTFPTAATAAANDGMSAPPPSFISHSIPSPNTPPFLQEQQHPQQHAQQGVSDTQDMSGIASTTSRVSTAVSCPASAVSASVSTATLPPVTTAVTAPSVGAAIANATATATTAMSFNGSAMTTTPGGIAGMAASVGSPSKDKMWFTTDMAALPQMLTTLQNGGNLPNGCVLFPVLVVNNNAVTVGNAAATTQATAAVANRFASATTTAAAMGISEPIDSNSNASMSDDTQSLRKVDSKETLSNISTECDMAMSLSTTTGGGMMDRTPPHSDCGSGANMIVSPRHNHNHSYIVEETRSSGYTTYHINPPRAATDSHHTALCQYYGAGFCVFGHKCTCSHDAMEMNRSEDRWLNGRDGTPRICLPPGFRTLPHVMPQRYKFIAVLDLEGTDDIVEMSSVVLSMHTMCEVARFHRFIKADDFDRHTTGMNRSSETVNLHGTAVPFAHALGELTSLLKTLGVSIYEQDHVLFAVSGDWDLKTQIPKACRNAHIPLPIYLNQWLNINDFALHYYNEATPHDVKGIISTLNFLSLPVLGQHCLGMDNTANIGRIIFRLIEDSAILERTAWRDRKTGKLYCAMKNRIPSESADGGRKYKSNANGRPPMHGHTHSYSRTTNYYHTSLPPPHKSERS